MAEPETRSVVLTRHEARALGSLIEKASTTPDQYPLTLNAVVVASNQKSSRDPVIEASEDEVASAIDQLKSLSLVMESSGGRVMRYAHNVQRVLEIPAQAVAILTLLMLRGPQTAGELRINCERMHSFADISAVQGFLDELATRSLVVQLPRLPGARENRWAHVLSGTPKVEPAVPRAEKEDLAATVARLEGELAGLKEIVARIAKQLGI